MGKDRPLWLQVLRDPAAKAWIKKHSNEFPTESFLPDTTCFKDKIVLAREKLADIIADGQPYPDPKQQTLSELVLVHTPRVIAKMLKIPRREAYLRIRALKRAALKAWEGKRQAALNARGRRARLPEAPEGIALRTIRFESGEREIYAYEIQLTSERTWLDAEGKRFTPDVQEILNNLEKYKVNFTTLEVYHDGARKES